jgi:nitroreductase
MDLIEALRTTGAVRDFRPDPVADDLVATVLDNARFAPNGGNRQSWRVLLLKDPVLRRALRDLYVRSWYEYLAQASEGLTPWAVITDRVAEARAIARAHEIEAAATAGPGGFAEHFDEVPVLLVVLADLRLLATVDRDVGRYGLAGGASVYPFVWNIILAARVEGLRGVITTMPLRREPELKTLLEVPDEFAVAAVVALGYPPSGLDLPRRLARASVAEFASVDRVNGPALQLPR